MRGIPGATAVVLPLAAGSLVLAGSVTDSSDRLVWALNLAAGAVILGTAVSATRFTSRYAVLTLVAGAAWLFGDVVAGLVLVHRPLLMWAALAFPTGALGTVRGRVMVLLACSAAVLSALATSDVIWLSLAVGLALVAAADVRLGARRSEARVALRTSLLLAVAIAFPAAARLLGTGRAAERLLLIGYLGLVLAVAAVLLAGTAGQPGRDADAVIELTGADPGETLAMLRREAARTTSTHQPAVRAAITLLNDHERLTVDLARRSIEVRASQQRLREAAEFERLRLQRLLERGALRLVDRLAATLRECAHAGDAATVKLATRCCGDVDAARDDLRRLLGGLQPRVLAEEGLGAALAQLTEGFAVPVRVCAPQGRFPPALEATLWYVCAEAVANMGKHSAARSGRIDVWRDNHHVVARIADDGVGGAVEESGGGLRGLRERVGDLAGTLRVSSPVGDGTVLEARVPCD
jgi:signal transduction histidine kinase